MQQLKSGFKGTLNRFLGILLGILGANSLVNVLAGKGVIRAGEEAIRTSWGQGKIRGV